MTEEEMADEYAKNNKQIYGSDEYADITDYLSIKKAFLAGLKAGKPKWHKVADGDLPKENKICLLYFGSRFNPITGWIKDGIWYFEDDRKNGVWQSNVIAWKEIVLPKEE